MEGTANKLSIAKEELAKRWRRGISRVQQIIVVTLKLKVTFRKLLRIVRLQLRTALPFVIEKKT